MDPHDQAHGGFDEYRRLILENLEQLRREISRVGLKVDALRETDLASMKVDIALLKFKASMWGALGGAGAAFLIQALVEKVFRGAP